MHQMLRLLQMNLFEKWSIDYPIHGRSAEKIPINKNQ